MLETERELAKLGVPVKTRHNEVAPNQYEIAPIFENSNVGSDHQQLTMQMHAERRAPLRARLPAAREAVRRRQRLGQAQQLVDGHRQRARTCSSPATRRTRTSQFLFFCAAVIQAVNKHQGLLRASIASPGQDHRLGANEAPPAIISIFLGAELEKVFDAIERGEARRVDRRSRSSASARRCCRRCPKHGGDRNRTSPFAFTGNKFEFRALGSSMSLSLPNTVLNTIVAEAIDDLAEELENALRRRAGARDALPPDPAAQLRRQQADRLRRRQLLRGVARRGRERGLLNLRATPGRAAVPDLRRDRRRCSPTTACCPSASSSRATRCSSSST